MGSTGKWLAEISPGMWQVPTTSHTLRNISCPSLALLLVHLVVNAQEAVSHFTEPALTLKHEQFSWPAVMV